MSSQTNTKQTKVRLNKEATESAEKISAMKRNLIIKNYNFLACDWFKKTPIFFTNSLAKLLSDS